MTCPVFVIGLPQATGRAALIERELASAGLSAARIDAVDASAVSRDTLLRDCKEDGPWGYFQTKDMACTLSHAKAWETFLATGEKIALILEDDVFLSPEIAAWINDLSWWPDDAGLVRFERWCSPRLRVALSRRHFVRHLGRDVRLMLSRSPGGAAYAITREAAELFLRQKPFDITIDNLLFNASASPAARQTHIYQIQPALAEQGNEAPGEVAMGPPRYRPTGAKYWRQKLRRAKCELRGGLTSAFNLLVGRIRLERIGYATSIDKANAFKAEDFAGVKEAW